ncbi:peptidoglycan-binding protein [Streptomyces sp. NPDC052012]|uniref:peptidoglycan-binding protein n=1 Tax=Streptomyces sp. NPDC052012 TaxID=3155051 RepID=UPI00344E82A9
MESPVFEEFEPANDCDCPGCVHWRRVLPHSRGGPSAGHPAARRALVVATAASTAIGAPAVPALAAPPPVPAPADTGIPAGEGSDTPQGPKAPLHGPGGHAAPSAAPVEIRAITRAEIIRRARKWVTEQVPYNMNGYWPDGYRQDCSGYVSMAWNLPRNEWTGSLKKYAEKITKAELQPGDMLLFHNPADPLQGSHVVLFGGWTDATRTAYVAYEQARPRTRSKATPYAYWSNSGRYVPYRYKGVTGSAAAPGPAAVPRRTPFPGAASFGPGAYNKYVTELGRMLAGRGGARFYTVGPGPRWTEADRRATRAFQQAQGWRGTAADRLPGPVTWELLVTGRGKDIPRATKSGASASVVPAPPGRPAGAAPAPSSHGVPGYPGRAMFRPGANNAYVTQLGRQLVKKGFGRYYTTGPGPRWSEADRRGVEAFQRAQGWRGGAADGYPGPETWRRLFL